MLFYGVTVKSEFIDKFSPDPETPLSPPSEIIRHCKKQLRYQHVYTGGFWEIKPPEN